MSKRVQRTESIRKLPVKLTEPEVAGLGRRIAELMEQRALTEALRKSQQKDRKAEIDRFEREIEDKRCSIRSGEELRDVPVDIYKDYQRGIVETVRLDTGVAYEIRDMTDEERQMEMRFEDEPESDAEGQPEPEDEELFDVETEDGSDEDRDD